MIKASDLRDQQQERFKKDHELELKKVEELITEAASNPKEFKEYATYEGKLSDATIDTLEEAGYTIHHGVTLNQDKNGYVPITTISWKEETTETSKKDFDYNDK